MLRLSLSINFVAGGFGILLVAYEAIGGRLLHQGANTNQTRLTSIHPLSSLAYSASGPLKPNGLGIVEKILHLLAN